MVLAAAALATTELKVGTSILLIGERHPMITAREAATLDHFSNGRFLFGVGVGWSHEEYEAMGIPFARRGPRCDEYIDAMKVLWTEAKSSFHGEFAHFDDVLAYPKPIQQPHPPVLVGGNTGPALRRAAKRGEGWFGWNLPVPELEKTVAKLDGLLAAEGRSRDGFILQTGLPHFGDPSEIPAYLKEAERIGIDRIVLSVPISRRNYADQMAAYATALSL
jgi:probable F420-dependent oxidoreductase